MVGLFLREWYPSVAQLINDRLDKLQKDKRTSSAYGFLMLLKRMRRIILQDSALMRLEYPGQFIFRDSLFKTDLYKAYAETIVKAENVPETPLDLRLREAMPRIVDHVDIARDAMLTGLSGLQLSFGQDIQTLAVGLEKWGNQVEESRLRDNEVLGGALSNIAAGLTLMSSAVMETRMVFPGIGSCARPDHRTHRSTPGPSGTNASANTANSTPCRSAVPPPISPADADTTANAATTADAMSFPTDTSPAARILSALKRTGEQGRLLFEGDVGGLRMETGSTRRQEGGDVREFLLEKDHTVTNGCWMGQGLLRRDRTDD